MNIQNCSIYSNNAAFQGNLIKGEGIKLAKSKLDSVAKLYKEKSGNLPDITLTGHRDNGDSGRFFYCADMIIDKDVDFMRGSESVAMNKFKKMFTELSPDKVANVLVNMARRGSLISSILDMKHQIAGLNIKLSNIELKIAQMERNPQKMAKSIKQYNVLADNITKKKETLEAKLAKEEQNLAKIRITKYFDGWIF